MEGYNGTVTMVGGLRPLDGQNYMLVSADNVQATADGKALDEVLTDMETSITGLDSSVSELLEDIGLATDEDIDALF